MADEKQYDNTNRGALFTNQKKVTENHPDYTGKINVDGVEYWLSAWVKDTRAGRILSLSVGDRTDGFGESGAKELAPTPVRQQQAPRQDTGAGFDDMDDDIPF